MNRWKTAALAAALVAAAGLGAAMVPVAHGQDVTVYAAAAPEPFDIQDVRIWTGGGRLGVTVREVGTDDAKRGGQSGGGVVIEEVSRDSAAEKAGFKKGDIVVDFDGERVRSVRQFTRLVQETASGRAVNATVIRDGQKTTLSVTPRESDAFAPLRDLEVFRDNFSYSIPARPAIPRPPAPPATPRAPLPREFEGLLRLGTALGVTVNTLSPQLADYFGVKDGVLVSSVADDSAAAKAGVKAGDVITAVNGTRVNDSADIRRAMQDVKPGTEFTVEVVRDKKTLTLKGKMEERTPAVRRRVIV